MSSTTDQILTMLSSTVATPNDSTTAGTATANPHIRLLDQLFLETVTCQIITGFFAWAALILTVHHVSFFCCNIYFDFICLKLMNELKIDISAFAKLQC